MVAVTKPRVTVIAANHFAITIGSHRATVKRAPSITRGGFVFHDEHITFHGKDGIDTTFVLVSTQRRRYAEDVLAFVVDYFAAIEDSLVYCDELLARGEALSKKARKALEKKLAELHHDRGILPLSGYQEGAFALVVADGFVRYIKRGVQTFVYRVGDECVVSSYNLAYIGTVTKITDGFVWCRAIDTETRQRHTLSSFYTYNDQPLSEVHERNAETRMYI